MYYGISGYPPPTRAASYGTASAQLDHPVERSIAELWDDIRDKLDNVENMISAADGGRHGTVARRDVRAFNRQVNACVGELAARRDRSVLRGVCGGKFSHTVLEQRDVRDFARLSPSAAKLHTYLRQVDVVTDGLLSRARAYLAQADAAARQESAAVVSCMSDLIADIAYVTRVTGQSGEPAGHMQDSSLPPSAPPPYEVVYQPDGQATHGDLVGGR